MKDKQGKDIFYAFADYKQLVLAYKTKYAELIKTATFWKTSMLWLAILTTSIIVLVLFFLAQLNRNLAESKNNINWLNNKIEDISGKLDSAQRELGSTKEELNKKEALIKELEKDTSTASKRLLEKLLREQEGAAEAK
jgi:septal ring factor EnvC (AmiA/AmiB activator)